VGDGFSTVEVAADERVEFWREMVRRHFVPLRVEPFAGRGFNGSAHLRSIAALDFARVRADPMRASRGWGHIERSARDEYFIGLQLRGLAVGDQDGRRAVLRPGDFALFDSARPYRIAFHSSGPFDHLIVRIPRAQLDLRCPSLERATALAITARGGPGRLASTSLRTLAALEDGGPFVDPVLDLLGGALSVSAGLRAPPPRREQRALEDLKRYTINHLGDPTLSPARVASACFVSVRQLHRLFAREHTTFGAFLRQSRLRRSRRDLADPRLASLTIGEIARHNGYRNAATFTRSFTERYGEGPRAFRSAR
jgi:AraC-like DNA-binding protein